MGRRRRRRRRLTTIRRPRRQVKYFTCPICHKPTLTIDFKKLEDEPGMKLAIVKCGSCGLNLQLKVPEVYERVDVYSIVVDKVYSGELEEASVEEAAAEGAEEAEEVGVEEGGEVEGEGSELPSREEEER